MAWFITQHGFTSVVAYDARKDQNPNSQHPSIAPNPGTHVLIRARVEEDLFPLRQVCPGIVIEEDPLADYTYRAVLSRDLFKKYLALEVDQITYGAHFKEVFQQNAHLGDHRYGALMKVWGLFADWQPFSPYNGTYRGPLNQRKRSTRSQGLWSGF